MLWWPWIYAAQANNGAAGGSPREGGGMCVTCGRYSLCPRAVVLAEGAHDLVRQVGRLAERPLLHDIQRIVAGEDQRVFGVRIIAQEIFQQLAIAFLPLRRRVAQLLPET